MNGNIGSSLLLLLVALTLLWLAATDRLSRIIDAWDYVRSGPGGTLPASTTTTNRAIDTVTRTVLSLPSLPEIGHASQVPI